MLLKITRLLLLTVLIFLLLYGQTFSVLPIGVSKILILLFLPFIIYDASKRIKVVSLSFIKIIVLWSIAVFLALFSVLLNETGDFGKDSFLYVLVLEATEFLVSGFLISLLVFYNIKRVSFERYLVVIASVIFLQGLFIIISFISPAFRNQVDVLLPISGNITADSLLRMRGVSNSSGATLSIVQCVGFLFSMGLAVKLKQPRFRILAVLSMITQIIAIMLTGRSGLIGVSLFILAYPYVFYEGTFFNTYFKFFRGIVVVVTSLVVLLSLVYINLDSTIRLIINEHLIDYAFEPFLKGVKGEVSDSQQDLSSMISFPSTIKTWIIGDGKYLVENGANYMGTDSGYLKTLYFFGILGSLALYGYKVWTIRYTVALIGDPNYKRLVVVLGIFLLLFQIKEPFLTKPEISKILFSLMFILIMIRSRVSFQKIW